MKSPRKKLIDKLDIAVKAKVRERDHSICQRCGKYVEGSNCHISHVIPVSGGNKLRWDMNNMKVLCYHDHINWWHKNPMEAAKWFEERFPERWAYLQANRGIQKFSLIDLEELLDGLQK